jgi:amidase
VRAVEVLEMTLQRIEALDRQVNAIVVRDFERALQAAANADALLSRGRRAPLLGVPVTVKESFNVSGLDTTWGLPQLRGYQTGADSIVVQRLRNAGAVILGKTNVCTALSDWQCGNEVYGRTNNPWDPTRTPGGSSGGSAAAVAAGMSFLDIGSDVAGSIRIPAHYCGVYGHRSTASIISGQGHQLPGIFSTPELRAIGPLARTPADLALALKVLVGPGSPDARAWRLSLPAPQRSELRDYRVLLLDSHPLVQTSRTLSAAVHRVGDLLGGAGAKVSYRSNVLPDLAATAECFARLLIIQNTARFGTQPTAAFPYPLNASGGARLIALGHAAAAGNTREWFAALEARALLIQQWRRCFQYWDIVVCPSSTTNAFVHDTRALHDRELNVDGTATSYFDHLAWISPAALAGLPATQFPFGLDPEHMPIGLQAMGAPYDDLATIAFTAHLERAQGGFVPPSLI